MRDLDGAQSETMQLWSETVISVRWTLFAKCNLAWCYILIYGDFAVLLNSSGSSKRYTQCV